MFKYVCMYCMYVWCMWVCMCVWCMCVCIQAHWSVCGQGQRSVLSVSVYHFHIALQAHTVLEKNSFEPRMQSV